VPEFTLRTGEDVRETIDWEGGICGAIDWGLDPSDLPERYRAGWTEICQVYAHLDQLCTAFYGALPPPPDE
jgi:hypothetical protein